jgi:AraC-like DNA-binding protein
VARDHHWLVQLIGPEAARHLTETRGGEVILVPIGPTARAAATQRLIRSALAEGHSIEATARLANVHARTVYRHKKRYLLHGAL